MELGLNPDLPDDRVPVPDAGLRAGAQSPREDGTAGEIANGQLVVQVGEAGGAVLRAARRAERAHIRPHPRPVMLRPRLLRGVVDRRTETAAALSALDAGLPVEVIGGPGAGKTALLRHLAYHPRAAAFADGIVYLPAAHLTALDLSQRIFDAFFTSDTACKPAEPEIGRGLHDTHALILLDDVGLAQSEVERLLEIAPRSAFVVTTRERCLWGEARTIALTGLAAEDGASLLERELERTLDADEQSAAAALCGALDGHPRRILQAATLIRQNAVPAADWSNYITLDSLVAELMTSIDDRERRVLQALSAMSGVRLDERHVSGLAEVADVEPVVTALIARGLVLRDRSRYRLADGVADRLRRSGDLVPWVHRAITYFTAWADRQRRNRDTLLESSDALVRVQQNAIDTRRWGEALRLGRLLEGAFALGAEWGAWEIVLERCLTAAKALGDRTVEAWALHQLGTRALCVGDEGDARRLLTQASKLREALGESAAAATSRRNLGFLPAARVEDASDSSASVAKAAPVEATAAIEDFASLALHSDAGPTGVSQPTRGAGAWLMTLLACAMTAALAFAVTLGALSWRDSTAAGDRAALPPVEPSQTAGTASDLPLRETTEVITRRTPDTPIAQRANILIFTARPGSIATYGPTSLCYAVRDAAQVRIEPGVGDVDPAGTLTCRRVAPARTTTYELTATGRDGVAVSQHLVIVVRPARSRAF